MIFILPKVIRLEETSELTNGFECHPARPVRPYRSSTVSLRLRGARLWLRGMMRHGRVHSPRVQDGDVVDLYGIVRPVLLRSWRCVARHPRDLFHNIHTYIVALAKNRVVPIQT